MPVGQVSKKEFNPQVAQETDERGVHKELQKPGAQKKVDNPAFQQVTHNEGLPASPAQLP